MWFRKKPKGPKLLWQGDWCPEGQEPDAYRVWARVESRAYLDDAYSFVVETTGRDMLGQAHWARVADDNLVRTQVIEHAIARWIEAHEVSPVMNFTAVTFEPEGYRVVCRTRTLWVEERRHDMEAKPYWSLVIQGWVERWKARALYSLLPGA